MANSRKSKLVVTVVLGLLPLLYFHEAVVGKVALLQGDGWTANLGLRILTGKLLTQGILPLWNPYIFGGMPLLASIYPGVLYPPNWLFAVLPPGLAMNLVIITTFHIALIGAYRYARCIGCDRAAALVTALGFAFGGYLVMSLGQTANITTAAWLPWILLVVEKLYQRPSRQWVALGAICIALQFFAGVPQMTWHTIITGGGYFFFSLFVRDHSASRTRFALNAGMMSILGVLLSMIQLLPLRELQQASGRARLSYEQFAEFSFPIKQVWSLIIPFVFGGATMPPYHVPYTGEAGIFVTCGYVGLLVLMLAFVAVIGARQEQLVWFWAVAALAALLLSFGSYLPFQLNQLLFKLPVYQLFRASYRHMFEFTFALAVLAGLGLDWLLRQDALKRRSVWLKGCVLIGLLFVAAVATSGEVAQTGWARPELLIPCVCLLASGGALGLLVWRPGWFSKSLLLAVLGADLLSYGHALEWRTYSAKLLDDLRDPPAVQFIKQREPDLNAFRILSYSLNPFGESYSALNYPNNAIARELHTVNGYDMLRLTRPAEMLGTMTPEGVVTDLHAFDTTHQGLNLFNVKYLLAERAAPVVARQVAASDDVIHAGVRFPAAPLDLPLRTGQRRQLSAGGALADELTLVTTLANAGQVQDNAPVARIQVRLSDGRQLALELWAGRDTAEWAYDRADVRAVVRHRRARVVESWPEAGFDGHRYLARLRFARGTVEALELEAVEPSAALVLYRAVLFDSLSGQAFALYPERWLAQRWQKLAALGEVEVYENQTCLPRAWIVGEMVTMPRTEVLHTIAQGRFADGRLFDPAQTALVETADAPSSSLLAETIRPDSATPASVRTLRSTSAESEYVVSSQRSALLVLSEVFYPGWEAHLDERPTPLLRVNYALRGVSLPAGEHRVRLRFRPPSVQRGAALSLLGVALLLVCRWPIRRLQKQENRDVL